MPRKPHTGHRSKRSLKLESVVEQISPVILCGGNGTRLWPRSRASHPKPFLPLIDNATLFQSTIARCSGEGFAPATVVTGASHLRHARDQGGKNMPTIIVEPEAKNTAPAIALAAARLPKDRVMLVCPSDHYIADPAAFVRAAEASAALAREGWLVAFGVEAVAPETGFGYIRQGEPLVGYARRVAQFVEKPDRARAEQFLADGGYYWNGGIFSFTAGRYLEELARHRPVMAAAIQVAVAEGQESEGCFHPDPASFSEIEGDSIDYAVMENTDRAAVVPASMGWSDIGNWSALQEARSIEQDRAGNIARGTAEFVDCRNVMVDSDGPRVSVIGLENLVVVVDGDEVLVTTQAGAQKVGKLEGATNQ